MSGRQRWSTKMSTNSNRIVKTLSNNIRVFFQINEMPIPIDVRRIDDGEGIDNTLINHHAKYHEACWWMFTNIKLQRAQQRRCPSEKRSTDQSTSSKFTRKATSVAAKEMELELVKCFICEKFVGRSEVREAMTMQLNNRLNMLLHRNSNIMLVVWLHYTTEKGQHCRKTDRRWGFTCNRHWKLSLSGTSDTYSWNTKAKSKRCRL